MGRAWIVVGVLLLAGCGGGSGGAGNESKGGGAVVETIQISEKEFSLTPATVNLSKTGTYEFRAKNDGQTTHALEIEGNGVEEETEDIGTGSAMTLRVTLSKDGSYEMYCPVDGHRDQGMKGTIVVGSTAGSGSATTDEDEMGETTTSERPGY